MPRPADGQPLAGRVALVTGASRGIGKGIAVELGLAGATVYFTGRTTTPGADLPGSLADTAAELEAHGASGVALACDHHDDTAVAEVFARIEGEQGRLDVLVNNVYSSPALAPWLGRNFWDLPIEAWDQNFDIGVRSHYVASVFGAPMLRASSDGLIVNVSSRGAAGYLHNLPYGVAKAALDRFTADAAVELRASEVAVVSLWPGLTKTEFVSRNARGQNEVVLPEGSLDLSQAESPRFSGRAVVALAADAGRMARTGQAWPVAALAADYGFTDIDGRVPDMARAPHRGAEHGEKATTS